jgi:hypothetical protein
VSRCSVFQAFIALTRNAGDWTQPADVHAECTALRTPRPRDDEAGQRDYAGDPSFALSTVTMLERNMRAEVVAATSCLDDLG